MLTGQKPQVLAVAEFIATETIDSGHTVAVSFRLPSEEELVVLVPVRVAISLNDGLTKEVGQLRSADHPGYAEPVQPYLRHTRGASVGQ